jgi:hypothetical protein
MEYVYQTLTLALGVLLIAALGFEINRKRRKLRYLYDVLNADDTLAVSNLDLMVERRQLQPWQGPGRPVNAPLRPRIALAAGRVEVAYRRLFEPGAFSVARSFRSCRAPHNRVSHKRRKGLHPAKNQRRACVQGQHGIRARRCNIDQRKMPQCRRYSCP